MEIIGFLVVWQFNDDEFAPVVFAEQVDRVGLIILIFGDGYSVEDGGHPNILPEQFAEEALKDPRHAFWIYRNKDVLEKVFSANCLNI